MAMTKHKILDNDKCLAIKRRVPHGRNRLDSTCKKSNTIDLFDLEEDEDDSDDDESSEEA